MASSCPSGLVPDSQAVFQEAKMSLFLPWARLDLSQSGACLHHLDMGIILNIYMKKKKKFIFRWRLLVVSILLNIKPPLNCISSFKNKEQQFSCINRGQLVNPTKLNVKGIITSFNLREFAGSMLDLHHWKCTVIERSVSVFFFMFKNGKCITSIFRKTFSALDINLELIIFCQPH